MLLCLGPGLAQANEGYPIDEHDLAFVRSLQQAIANDQKIWIADQVSFPIHATLDGRRRMIRTKKQFLARYADIINEQVKTQVAQKAGEDLADLFKDWQGIMIGNGVVWIGLTFTDPKKPKDIEYSIIAINNDYWERLRGTGSRR